MYGKDLICRKPIVVSDSPGLLPNLDQISRPIHLSSLITVWDQRSLSMNYFTRYAACNTNMCPVRNLFSTQNIEAKIFLTAHEKENGRICKEFNIVHRSATKLTLILGGRLQTPWQRPSPPSGRCTCTDGDIMFTQGNNVRCCFVHTDEEIMISLRQKAFPVHTQIDHTP